MGVSVAGVTTGLGGEVWATGLSVGEGGIVAGDVGAGAFTGARDGAEVAVQRGSVGLSRQNSSLSWKIDLNIST